MPRALNHAGSYRSLFTFLAHTGLRIGETPGLVWGDVDFDSGVLHVHRQLSRYREHAPLKTEAAEREAVLAPAIVRLLRERRLASPYEARRTSYSRTRSGALPTTASPATHSAPRSDWPSSKAPAGSPCTHSATGSPHS